MTIDDQIKEAKRELAMRELLYPKWIAAGRLKPDVASRQIELMRGIVVTLQRCMTLNV